MNSRIMLIIVAALISLTAKAEFSGIQPFQGIQPIQTQPTFSVPAFQPVVPVQPQPTAWCHRRDSTGMVYVIPCP